MASTLPVTHVLATGPYHETWCPPVIQFARGRKPSSATATAVASASGSTARTGGEAGRCMRGVDEPAMLAATGHAPPAACQAGSRRMASRAIVPLQGVRLEGR